MIRLKSMDQVQISIIKDRILTNLKNQNIASYDLLKEICGCEKDEFAIALRQLLRGGAVTRDNQKGGYRIK